MFGVAIPIGSHVLISMIQVRVYGYVSTCFLLLTLKTYVAAKRSRLVTVTMDGKLDIWDFDVAGQVIFKDRSSENQPRLIKETTSDRVIGLKSCPFYHGLCMVLTRKNAIVSFLQDHLVYQF